jgi:ABC-type multidrug transport system ATPase subunit
MSDNFVSVEFDSVVFSYSKREVLQEINLIIEESEIFGLLGANGAGKTTLIRLIMGIIRSKSS